MKTTYERIGQRPARFRCTVTSEGTTQTGEGGTRAQARADALGEAAPPDRRGRPCKNNATPRPHRHRALEPAERAERDELVTGVRRVLFGEAPADNHAIADALAKRGVRVHPKNLGVNRYLPGLLRTLRGFIEQQERICETKT